MAASPSIATDVNGEPRPSSSVDIGADEWINTDGDTLPNWWENFWFGNLAQNDAGDPNGNTVNNLNEYFSATPPTDDQDGDGLPDLWETTYWINIGIQNSSGNPDGDMATNLQELYFSNPTFYDTDWDGDGWTDADEWTWFGTFSETPQTDFDADGLSNGFEQTLGSSMTNRDSNQDGLFDGYAYTFGYSVSGTDTDGDGLSNATELAMGTSPILADTDGDGVNDGTDFLPLNASISGGSANVPGPPVISLSSPPGAVLLP
jgi:hypothetical protein